MFSIPNIPTNYKIKINGKIAKLYNNLIKQIISITLYKERIKETAEVEVIICDTKKMYQYNKEFLKQEGSTDVISIAYEKDPKAEHVKILGTIFICPNQIKIDSEELKKNYIKHMTHLLVHSTLHLLGYDHQEEGESKRMEMKEINILSFLGIGSPYL